MQNYDLAADDSWDWTREQIHPTKLGVLYRDCVFHADNTYVGKVHAPIFHTTCQQFEQQTESTVL